MTITVVCTGTGNADFVAAFLPDTNRIARGGDRLYFFYVTGGLRNVTFNDHAGQSLIEVHNFDTISEAEAWANEDARQRQALLSIEGGAH